MLVKVNGRLRFFSRLSELRDLGGGKYIIVRHDVEYRVEGGKRAGGTRRDWFVDAPGWAKSIVCTSLMDAARMIDGM